MKSWYHSKTIWVNLLVFAGSLYSGITGDSWLDGEMQLMVLAVVDFVLRLVTKQGLSIKAAHS